MQSYTVKGLLSSVQKALPLFQDGGGISISLDASVAASSGLDLGFIRQPSRPYAYLLDFDGLFENKQNSRQRH